MLKKFINLEIMIIYYALLYVYLFYSQYHLYGILLFKNGSWLFSGDFEINLRQEFVENEKSFPIVENYT